MTKCPCKDCERRRPPDCHSTCNDYTDWKKLHDKEREQERLQNGVYPTSYGGWIHTREGYWRNHKTRRKR